jgi:hypothetical protein
MKALLVRLKDDGIETIGKLLIINGNDLVLECNTLELPFKANIRNISCIPIGGYVVGRRYSERHGEHLKVYDVDGRSHILIHSANYVTELRGCISVGKYFVDINKDGNLDVSNSRDSLNKILCLLTNEETEEFNLEIINL